MQQVKVLWFTLAIILSPSQFLFIRATVDNLQHILQERSKMNLIGSISSVGTNGTNLSLRFGVTVTVPHKISFDDRNVRTLLAVVLMALSMSVHMRLKVLLATGGVVAFGAAVHSLLGVPDCV